MKKEVFIIDKFMSEMRLRQSGFTYSTCGSSTKKKERIELLKETGDSRYIYQDKLHKACFQHDIVYGDFKDLPARTTFEKVLRDETFKIA